MNAKAAKYVLCLGFFDGVHRGHIQLLRQARAYAAEKGCSVCVHTFDTSPAAYITGKRQLELTGVEEKTFWLRRFGADEVLVTHFDRTVQEMSGEAFIQALLQKMNVVCIAAGEDHRFGAGGKAGAGTLQEICRSRGIDLILVPPVCFAGGKKLSSSDIRQRILAGKTEEAKDMLGHEINMLSHEKSDHINQGTVKGEDERV